MLTPIKMTDKQRLFFADKLAHLPDPAISDLVSRGAWGQSYEAFSEYIANDLLDPARVDFYRPLLEQVGFKS